MAIIYRYGPVLAQLPDGVLAAALAQLDTGVGRGRVDDLVECPSLKLSGDLVDHRPGRDVEVPIADGYSMGHRLHPGSNMSTGDSNTIDLP